MKLMFIVAMLCVSMFAKTTLTDLGGTIAIQTDVPNATQARAQAICKDATIPAPFTAKLVNGIGTVPNPCGEYESIAIRLMNDRSEQYGYDVYLFPGGAQVSISVVHLDKPPIPMFAAVFQEVVEVFMFDASDFFGDIDIETTLQHEGGEPEKYLGFGNFTYFIGSLTGDEVPPRRDAYFLVPADDLKPHVIKSMRFKFSHMMHSGPCDGNVCE